MNQNKLSFKVLVFLLIASLALAACGNNTPVDSGGNNNTGNNSNGNNDSQTNSSNGDDDDGGMESMELSGDFNLDPAVLTDSDSDSLTASSYVYEGLVVMEDGSIAPGIAADWEVSDDGLTYEFTLRPNALFSDGTAVTADTVYANFYRWFDPANALHGDTASYAAWQANFTGFLGEFDDSGLPLSLFDGVEKVDNLTILLHLNEPVDNLLEILAQTQFSILQPETMAAGCCTSADGVVGSGPYVIADWIGDTITFTPSETYWGNQ